MKRLVTLVAAVVLATGACSDGDSADDEDATGTTTTTVEPTTSTSTTPETTADATTTSTTSPPTPPATCHDGSSDGVFDDATGTYATLLAELDPDAGTISFDVVQWYVGQDATDAWQAEYPDDPYGPPNDYFVRNDNPAVRTAPIAADPTVFLVRMLEDQDADLDPGTLDELPDYLASQPGEDGYASHNVYWLSFSDGSVDRICEQFTP